MTLASVGSKDVAGWLANFGCIALTMYSKAFRYFDCRSRLSIDSNKGTCHATPPRHPFDQQSGSPRHSSVHVFPPRWFVPVRQSVRYHGPPSSETGTPYRLIGATLVLKANPKLLPAQAQSIVFSNGLSRNGLRSRGWLVLSWTRTRARR